MTPPLTPEDQALDVLWREAFGEPLPILGATEIVTQVLKAKRATDRRSKPGGHRPGHAPGKPGGR